MSLLLIALLCGCAVGYFIAWYFFRPAGPSEPLEDYLEKLELVTTELIEARLNADRADRAKNAFLVGMSHELRTPLNVIIGNVSLMLNMETNSKQERCLERIHLAAQLLMELINKVLDFSKLVAQSLQLEHIDCDLVKLTETCCQLLESRAQEKNISFCCTVAEGEIPLVLGDPTRIKQVLINLINNAIKFTEKGFVEVSLSTKKEEGQLLASWTIIDTGIGIAKDNQKYLFQPFWQAEPFIARKYGGSGLGLAISRELVQRMDGIITMTSEEGKGSTFLVKVAFPLSKNTV